MNYEDIGPKPKPVRELLDRINENYSDHPNIAVYNEQDNLFYEIDKETSERKPMELPPTNGKTLDEWFKTLTPRQIKIATLVIDQTGKKLTDQKREKGITISPTSREFLREVSEIVNSKYGIEIIET